VAIAALAGACSGEPSAPAGADAGVPDAPDADVFIAFASTFQDFRTWPSFASPGPADDGTFTPDVLGPRTQYFTHLRRKGAP
jgi:hypothetical protein